MMRVCAQIVANFMTMIAAIRVSLYQWYLKMVISDGVQVQGALLLFFLCDSLFVRARKRRVSS